MKLGVDSVLFGGHSVEAAFERIAWAGYDGIELSTIEGMGAHLVLSRWQVLVPEIKRLSREYGLALLAIKQPSLDVGLMEAAFRAAIELDVPIVNADPDGIADDEVIFQQTLEKFGNLSRMAEKYGVTLCVKAHIGKSVYNTKTMLHLINSVNSPRLGVDMDPSHVHRAGENPIDALRDVIKHIKHVHIRDCKGYPQGPGKPEDQANGRGDIDLLGFFKVLCENNYQGVLDLEIIGAKEYSLERCALIAAEARGHMRACLQACGVR
jgi:sugar phosphate isomerase/epimerase